MAENEKPWEKYRRLSADPKPDLKPDLKPWERRAEAEKLSWWGDVAPGVVKNFPSSFYEEIKNIATAVTSPIDTVTAMLKLGEGAIRLAFPGGDDPSEDLARQVGEMYSKKYGSIEGFKNALMKQPASVIADLSIFLTGGGSALMRAGGISGKVGNIAKAVGEYADPGTLVAKTAGAALRGKQLTGAMKKLDAEGIHMTPGQMSTGVFRGIEERIAGLPVVGSFIHGARARTIKELNIAAYNRALEPIGESAKRFPVGHAGVARVRALLSDGYEKILPKMKMSITPELTAQLDDIFLAAADEIDPAVLKRLRNIVDKRTKKMFSSTEIDGKALKRIQSDLNKISKGMKKSNLYTEQAAGDVLKEVNDLFKATLRDANPRYQSQIDNLDLGWKNYRIINRANKTAGDKSSGFTPAQLDSAVKALDETPGGYAAGEGKALMQDLSSAGVEVLPNKTPDSGTAGRAVLAATLAGGMAIEPTTALMAAASMVPYAKPSMTAGLLTKRFAPLKLAGEHIGKVNPYMTQPFMQAGRVQGLLGEDPQQPLMTTGRAPSRMPGISWE